MKIRTSWVGLSDDNISFQKLNEGGLSFSWHVLHIMKVGKCVYVGIKNNER